MSRKEAARIYDSLPPKGKDMPRQEFIEEYERLSNPRKIAADAQKILFNKRQIDGGIGPR